MLITTQELASKLGVDPQTVLRMVARNQIPTVNLNPTGAKPSYRYDHAEVVAALRLAKTEEEDKS